MIKRWITVRINDNIILQKASGNIGKQVVLKRVHGRTVLSRMPKKPAARSTKQRTCAQGFKLATACAKSAMQNPELKALYSAEAKRRGVINVYNTALSDCLRLLEVKVIDIVSYTGSILGEVITIGVTDTFKVVEVTVGVISDVAIIGEGSVTFIDNRWQYVTTVLNVVVTDSKVVVTAVDRVGNKINKLF